MTGKIYRLDTKNTSLIFLRNGELVTYLYYGAKIGNVSPDSLYVEEDNVSNDIRNRLFSCFGNDDHRDKSILIFNSDNTFTNDFSFKSATTTKGKTQIPCLPSSNGAENTLTFEFYDSVEKLTLLISYSTYPDNDVITVRSSLKNAGKKTASIKKFASLQLDLSESGFTVSTFNGCWAGERYRNDAPLKVGTYINQSLSGASSAQHNPFSFIKNEKGIYAFNLVYSGNHKTSYESDSFNRIRVITGINDFAFEYRLKEGETFYAPEAVMLFSENEDEMTLNFHDFVNRHIIPERWQNKIRPVVINNWEGTEFNFTREKILDIAKAGKKIGAELFVLDDGWFGNRNDDTSSLGDWFDNVSKTGGLSTLADEIRALGLQFGIWIEPEMISQKSELYKKHPEFAMEIPERKPFLHRNQLMLDLTNDEVKKYVLDSIENVISLAKPTYIKWDFNRLMSDCHSDSIFIGEYCYRYVLSLYEIMGKITERYPDVLFEGCAAGGARFDLGILCYFPQIWTSDNTDANVRVDVQTNTSLCYPQSSMTAHLSASPNGFTKKSYSLENRFNVSCLFNFGYELDCSNSDDASLLKMANISKFYKKRRPLIQFGDYYNLGNTSDGPCGFEVVSPRKNTALAMIVLRKRENGVSNRRIKFKGLNAGKRYKVLIYDKNLSVFDEFFAEGEVLHYGIPFEKYRLSEEICSDADFRSILIELEICQ